MKRPVRKLIRQFDDWMIAEASAHVADGHSLLSFCGKRGIPQDLWHKWVREKQELTTLNELYKRKIRAQKRFG